MKNRKKGSSRLSEGKRLPIELIVSRGEENVDIEESTLIALFNGILYQRVKPIRKQRIRRQVISLSLISVISKTTNKPRKDYNKTRTESLIYSIHIDYMIAENL